LVETSDERRALLTHQAAQASRELLLRAVRAFNTALSEVRSGWQPQLPLELALIESTRPLPAESAPVAPAAAQPRRPIAPPPIKGDAEDADEPPAPASSAAALSLAKVRSVWAQVVMRVDQESRPLGALLKQTGAEPYRVRERQVTIAVKEKWARDKVNDDPAKQQLLTRALSAALGTSVSVKVVVADGTGSAEHDIMMDDPILKEQIETGAIPVEETEGD